MGLQHSMCSPAFRTRHTGVRTTALLDARTARFGPWVSGSSGLRSRLVVSANARPRLTRADVVAASPRTGPVPARALAAERLKASRTFIRDRLFRGPAALDERVGGGRGTCEHPGRMATTPAARLRFFGRDVRRASNERFAAAERGDRPRRQALSVDWTVPAAGTTGRARPRSTVLDGARPRRNDLTTA